MITEPRNQFERLSQANNIEIDNSLPSFDIDITNESVLNKEVTEDEILNLFPG